MRIKIRAWFNDEEFETEAVVNDNVSEEALSGIAFNYAIDELFAHGFGWDYEVTEGWFDNDVE